MKKYLDFVNELNSIPKLKYASFDWDDNILIMPTKIHMEHLENGEWVERSISTEKYAEVRTNSEWRSNDKSYIDFRDFGELGDNVFLEDVKKAIDGNSYGPAWEAFIECLISGSLFAIITARGHESQTIRKGVEYIIFDILDENQKNEMGSNLFSFGNMFNTHKIQKEYDFEELVEHYLDHCVFVGVSSPNFAKKYPELVDPKYGAANPEKGKRQVMKEFIEKIKKWGDYTGYNVSLGWSDDDQKNIDIISKYFNESKDLYDINFAVYDTSNSEIKGGIKTKI